MFDDLCTRLRYWISLRRARVAGPVLPKNSTVNGLVVRRKNEMWRDLDWPRAVARRHSTPMLTMVGRDAPLDVHIDVPCGHQCQCRVRPLCSEAESSGIIPVRDRQARYGWRWDVIDDK